MTPSSPALILTEVDEGPGFADAIFQRKYGQSAPTFAHHIVAFGRQADGAFRPLSYLHMTDHGSMFLAGGAATDGEAIRAMPDDVKAAIDAAGGLMFACLKYGIERFGPRVDAVAACCGDARALQVTPTVGLDPTPVEHLLMRFMRDLPEQRRAALIAEAQQLMPF